MLLKKIKLKNIRSYEEQEINFLEGSTLLSGDIGSGKTSILLGIEFALFGLQPGQRGSSILRNGKTSGGVIMEFEVERKKIIIERTLKKSKTISQDYCAITIDGEKREISVTELKNKILELLNYPKEFSRKQNILYKFTVYTPQEEMKQIILQDPTTRVNTLRHVFGIDKYKKILENTSILIVKLREERRIKEALTGDFEQNKLELISKEDELEARRYNLVSIEKELFLKTEKRKRIQEEQIEIAKKREEKTKIQQEIEKTKIMMSTKQETILSNKKLIHELQNQIAEYEKLSFDESLISNLEQENLLKKKEKEKISEENLEIISKINMINIKNEENFKLEQKISNLEVCPTCLQEVEAVYRTNVLNKLHNENSKNKNELEELNQKKIEFSDLFKKIDEEISSNERKIQEMNLLKVKLHSVIEKQNRLKGLEDSNISIDKDIILLSQHIDSLKLTILDLNRFDNIFELKQKELEEATKEERIAEIKVVELKKEIDFYGIQIKDLKEKIQKTEEIKEKLNYLISLEDWLTKKFVPVISHVERNVMIKLKAEFSQLFAEWFSMLVSDSFDVRLGDDFTPIIEQQDYEIDYAYLSGGERTAIALAYRLSLNQVINSLMSNIKTKDIVILDEPTDGFSEQQLDKMRDVLHQLDVKQLIIVSHEQKIEGFVENVIKFKKKNNVTRMEES